VRSTVTGRGGEVVGKVEEAGKWFWIINWDGMIGMVSRWGTDVHYLEQEVI